MYRSLRGFYYENINEFVCELSIYYFFFNEFMFWYLLCFRKKNKCIYICNICCI